VGYGVARSAHDLKRMSSDAVLRVGLVSGLRKDARVDALFQVADGGRGGYGLKDRHVGLPTEQIPPVPSLCEAGKSLLRVHGFSLDMEHVSKRLVDDMQHVLDKGRGMAFLVALGQCAVAFGLRAVPSCHK